VLRSVEGGVAGSSTIHQPASRWIFPQRIYPRGVGRAQCTRICPRRPTGNTVFWANFKEMNANNFGVMVQLFLRERGNLRPRRSRGFGL